MLRKFFSLLEKQTKFELQVFRYSKYALPLVEKIFYNELATHLDFKTKRL